MVGPDFHAPPHPRVKSYTVDPLPKKTAATPSAGKAGRTQTFKQAQNIPSEWWRLFHSRELNNLIDLGLANSPNLAAAYAALRNAQETLYAQIGSTLLPSASALVSGERQRFSEATLGLEVPPRIFNLFNTTVNVSYTLDVFGGARRQIESLKAQVDYQQFQLIAAYLTLTSNIVTTAIAAASYEAQIQASFNLLKSQEYTLYILRKQFQLGGIAKPNVLTQETLVEQTRATIPPLQKSLAQARHALAVLLGFFPNSKIPVLNLDSITLPSDIPVTLPSILVCQRPDVRASEALVHAASANIGVATANLLPQISITGTYGWTALVPNHLFHPISEVWSYLPSLTQPIFNGGALLARRRAAIDQYQQAWAQYKQTVLTAFQNVADSLRALETDARLLRDQRRAEISASENLNLSKQQYRLGGINYLILLTAQQQYQSTRLAVIQAKAARYSDTVALFQSLGGGWWNKRWCEKECFCDA